MKLAKYFSTKILFAALTISLVGFVILSWWLLFRDERAVKGFEVVYPFLNGSLFNTRHLLLQYSLNVIPTILFTFFALVGFGSYILLLKKEIAVRKVVIWSVVFQTIVFVSYPVLSTDIFSYIFSDRVKSEYGQNTWTVAPLKFTQDPFYNFADWKDQTNAYGYVHHLTYLPAVTLGGDDVFTTVLLYKLTAAAFAIASIFIFLHIVADRTEREKSFYLRLLFWNPLFLLEYLGSGHNDALMIFFLLSGLLFWQKKNWLLAGILLACSVQVKLLPIIYVGFLCLHVLQNKNLKGFFQFFGSFSIITAFSFMLMQVSPLTFLSRVFYNTTSYWQSLPALVERLSPGLDIPYTVVFALSGLALVFLQLKKNWNPIFTASLAFLIYFSFFTGAYWNWYVLWIFVVLSQIKNALWERTILLFTLTSLMAYPLLWFSHRFGFGNVFWSLGTYLWIFGVPIGFLGYNYCKLQKGKNE
ncbi:MAG: hypothetical protein BroJett025_06330 [Patescibacteria group bacterium]|nr:MAG: hypothetical protein BroJett025_06330 [Patescibacteria group bacterium]